MSAGQSKNVAFRRLVAVLLIVLGVLLMLLAPETWPGFMLLALGVAVELIGMALSHRLGHDRAPSTRD